MNDSALPPVIAPVTTSKRSRRGLWWKIPLALVGAFLVLVLILVLSFDEIVRRFVKARIKQTTGMTTDIAKFDVQPTVPAVHITGFRMNNTTEFGGQTFLSIPELLVSIDKEALQSNKLRLRLVRIDIGEVNVVVNQAGKTNLNELRLRTEAEQARVKAEAAASDRIPREQPEFAGVDRFEMKLNTIRYTDLRDPNYNRFVNLGLTNLVVENAASKEEFGVKFVLAALSSGIDVLNLIQGGIENLPRQDDQPAPPVRK
jgi:hypothetical protein